MKTYPAEQFHERRLKGIGGSDIGAIMGHNPWRSPLDVYLDKIGESKPIEDNFAMRFGQTMEVTLRKAYGELHNINIIHSDDDTLMIFESSNTLLPFYHHPDGIIDGPEGWLWEGKSSSRYSAWKDGPPPEVVDQCQWGLMLSGFEKCVVSLGLGAREYREFDIMSDAKYQEQLSVAGLAFWNDHVLKKIPPEPSGSESDRVWLDEAFDEADTVAPLTVELIDLASRRIRLSHNKITAEVHIDKIDQLIMNILGDHARAAGDNFKVTWKRPNPRKTLDKVILRDVLIEKYGLKQAETLLDLATKLSEQKRRFTFKEVADVT